MIGLRLATRGRLSGLLVLSGLAILGFSLFCAWLITVHQENRLVYNIVQQRAAMLQGLLDAPVGVVSAFGHVAPGVQERENLPARLRVLDPGYHLLTDEAEILHVIVRDHGAARIYAVYGDGPHRQRLQAHLRILIGVFLALGAGLVVLAKWGAGALMGLSPAILRRVQRPRTGLAMASEADERAHLAQSYGEYQDAMLVSQRCEREFIANVGHELRTPITLMMTGCELLAENESLDAAGRRQLQRIASAAEHMNETVRSFLILAREGSLGSLEWIELRACILEALEPHSQEIQARQLSVHVRVGADVVIQTNREALFVVVGNLVKNAIKYTEHGGISLHHLGQTLYVADTGCGIDEEDLPHLFQPFFRTRRVAEAGVPGLGLGLAIVKRICDFYGWSITARSTPGRGTTMSLEFAKASPSRF